jgi:hypothetical protein
MSGSAQPRSQQREEWHKAKIFSIAHLAATLFAIVGGIGVVWAFGQEFGVLKNDVSRHTSEIGALKQGQAARDEQLAVKLTAMRIEQKQDLQRIEDKIDKLIDRELRK